jgi:hypothetical protein
MNVLRSLTRGAYWSSLFCVAGRPIKHQPCADLHKVHLKGTCCRRQSATGAVARHSGHSVTHVKSHATPLNLLPLAIGVPMLDERD